nr:reverse transcriptase domain-containing protein [Tanacetum cinerariifolium]
MEQKLQARSERIIEGNKRKWESFQSWNSSGKSNHKDNSRQSSQNNQKQRNARAMTSASNEGNLSSRSLLVCEHCFTHHTCYDCGKQGYMRNRCPKNLNQEEVKEARGRAYAIKDTEPQGPNMVTGTFLFNNQYASILYDSGSDRSFVDTKFSFMLDIDPFKIDASYEVKLANERIVSTNNVLKGCTLDLVNHLFKINLMTIELGMFDVIISIDWLVNHDVVIICGEKVVCIPYRNKTLTVDGDKGLPPPSRVLNRFDQVKTMSRVQVSRPGELRRHLQLWKCLEDFILLLDGCVGLKCDKRNTGFVGFVGNNVTMLFSVDENDVIEAVKVVVYCSGQV